MALSFPFCRQLRAVLLMCSVCMGCAQRVQTPCTGAAARCDHRAKDMQINKSRLTSMLAFASLLLKLNLASAFHPSTSGIGFGVRNAAQSRSRQPFLNRKIRKFSLYSANPMMSISHDVPQRKLKILCLHGYGQNGEAVKSRSGGFRRPFKKKHFEVYYPDGPFVCREEDQDSAASDLNDMRRAWWSSGSRDRTYTGWEETHAKLCELWDAEEFDGVMGFSMGAAAAAMLCAEKRPRFGIFIAGFTPYDEKAAAALLAGVNGVPSLHVFGCTDKIVEVERSRALTELFADACIVEHEGGHMIPSGADVRMHVVKFVEGILKDADDNGPVDEGK